MEEENISQNVSTNYVQPPAITIATTTAIADAEPTDNIEVKEKSKKSQFGILKLAVGRFQPRPKTDQKKKKEKAKPAKSKKNVGSMRPSHLEEDIQSSTASVSVVSPQASPRKEDVNLSDENFICISDASSPTTSLSSKRPGIGTITPHASAVNLQELDNPMSQYSSAVNLQELDTTQSRYASAVNLQDLDAPMSQYGSTNNLQDLKEEEEMFKDPADKLIPLMDSINHHRELVLKPLKAIHGLCDNSFDHAFNVVNLQYSIKATYLALDGASGR